MGEYPSNSHRMKDGQNTDMPPRRAEKAIAGTAKQRKKSGLDTVKSIFLATDGKEVMNYILMDVLIPTIKRALYDMICGGAGMFLGERAAPRGRSPASQVSYRAYYDQPNEKKNSSAGSRAASNYSYNDLVFSSRGDAEVVLERMTELLKHFDAVSVADLFDLAGESGNYTDNKYGWTNLDDARVLGVRDGYIIQLPRATTL